MIIGWCLLCLQSELALYESRLHELQQNSEMLTAQNGSVSEVSSSVITLEKKIAEIKLYLASVAAVKTSSYNITSSFHEDSNADRCPVELQIVSPVEAASQSFEYEQSLTVTTSATTYQSRIDTTDSAVTPVVDTVAVEMVSMPKLDNFIAKLDKFAAVLSDKARSYPVVIGAIDEIDIASQTKKVSNRSTFALYKLSYIVRSEIIDVVAVDLSKEDEYLTIA